LVEIGTGDILSKTAGMLRSRQVFGFCGKQGFKGEFARQFRPIGWKRSKFDRLRIIPDQLRKLVDLAVDRHEYENSFLPFYSIWSRLEGTDTKITQVNSSLRNFGHPITLELLHPGLCGTLIVVMKSQAVGRISILAQSEIDIAKARTK
jgi:hypothetical protein